MTNARSTPAGSDDCPECDERLRTKRDETVCESCGLVFSEDAIDRGPEWRSFDGDANGRRTGAPLTETRHDKGLSTRIGFDAEGDVSSDRRRQLVRMRRQHTRSGLASRSDRNRRYAFTEIQRIVSVLSLPTSVSEQSCSMFATGQSEGLLPGRTIEGFAAAAVYATCRRQSIARTIEEVVEVARADRSEFSAAYDALNAELGLAIGPIDPTEYVPRYASEMDLPQAVERRAREFAVRLRKSGKLGGKNPSGVAAACLYKAAIDADRRINQSTVADVANVSRMTIGSTVGDIQSLP